MNNTARFFKPALLFLLALSAIPIAGYTQTVIDVTSSTSTTVDANQATGSPVTVNISGSAVLSGEPGITKTDDGDLTINFSGSSSIDTLGDGILLDTPSMGSFIINSTSAATGVINSDAIGIDANLNTIFAQVNIAGNFHNEASINSERDAIRIVGEVGGSLTNRGVLNTGPLLSATGIEVSGTINAAANNPIGFTNSGQIGDSNAQRVGRGMLLFDTITGDLINDSGGSIFSTNQGIFLEDNITGLTGNFTNHATIDSLNESAIEIDGAVGENFTNSGTITAGRHGFFIDGAVGGSLSNSGAISADSTGIFVRNSVNATAGNATGFTNNGAIGTSSHRVNLGIETVLGVTGNFLNDVNGDVFSVNQGLFIGSNLVDDAISLTGNFTNRATINSSNNTAIVLNSRFSGSFNNSGALLSGSDIDHDGIFINGSVGNGFTNSGTIGASAQRVGGSGIEIFSTVIGDFMNDTAGTIFSNNQGIFLDRSTTGTTGNFTNSASIDSSGSTAIQIDGVVGGSFANTGSLLTGTDADDDGIFIGSTLGNGFFNSGQIGSAAQRVGGMGIEIFGNVTGSFLNDTGGDIFSTEQAIYSQAVTNDFTNNATISSLNNRAIEVRGSVGGIFSNNGSIIEAGGEGIYIEGGVSVFENTGAITGTSGRGIRIEVGVDGSFENMAIVTGTGGDGISIEGDVGGTFVNSGNISENVGSAISIEGGAISSFENTGDLSVTEGSAISINLGVGGSFVNAGAITNTGGSGISIDGAVGGTFDNEGFISFTLGDGIFIEGAVGDLFVNNGEISDTGGSGISIGGVVVGAFENGGAISNTEGSGISLAAGVDDFFNNFGEITETGGSGISIDGAVGGFFENADAISVTLGDGIFLADSVGDFFVNSGEISQVDGNGISIVGAVDDLFENTGSITGTGGGGIAIVGAVGGAFINSGDIAQAGGSGISIEGAVGTLDTDGFTNTGQIGTSVQRVSGRGVEIAGTVTGAFLNDVGGDIFSTFQGVFLQAGVTGDVINEATIDSSNDIGIRIDGPVDGLFGNIGTITGFERAIEIGPNTTRFANAGTINGDVVLGTAITGGNAGFVQNAVVLVTGSVINGRLDVGSHDITAINLNGTGNAQLSIAVTEGIDGGIITDVYDFNGFLAKESSGTWTIDRDFEVGNGTGVRRGTLLIASGSTLATPIGLTVSSDATLGGAGSIHSAGDITISNNGILAPGDSTGTITFNGNLLLNNLTVLEYELDTPGVAGSGVNDLTVVDGNLTLDGVLNVTDLGGFAEGGYTLIQTTGVITDNGLTIGTLPPRFSGTISVTTDAVILEVISINQPPVAQNDEFLAFEDLVFSGNVFANNGAGADFDPDDDAFEVQSPGSFTASGIGGSIDLASNGNFTYTPPAATLGKATFTYTIEDPFGATDSATVFIDVIEAADLVLEKTSGSFFTPPGGTINYEILVVNAGPSDVIGAQVTDTPPPVLSNVTWDCMVINGATCQDANGVDQIDQTVDIPNGGAVMYTLSGTLPTTGNNPLTNTASVSNPLTELNPSDNTDSDTDLVGLFADGMESEEP